MHIQEERFRKNLIIFITSNNLCDIPGTNYSFTWFGPNQKSSRLDRVLINQTGASNTNWKLRALGRKQSDHLCLLLYRSKPIDWGPKPCRLFNTWLRILEVSSIIQDTLDRSSHLSIGVQDKLKLVRHNIQRWNINSRENMDSEIERLEKHLIHQDPNISPSQRRDIEKSLRAAYLLRESILEQKSRINLITEGDSNTKFFHAQVKRRNHNNHITRI